MPNITYKKVTGPTPGKVYYVQPVKLSKFLANSSTLSKEELADFVITNGKLTKSRATLEDLIEGYLNIHLYS